MSDIKNIYRSTPRQIKQYICTCLEAGLVPFLTTLLFFPQGIFNS